MKPVPPVAIFFAENSARMRLCGAIFTLLASIAATNSTCVPVCTNDCVGGPTNYTKDGWCDDGGPGVEHGSVFARHRLLRLRR